MEKKSYAKMMPHSIEAEQAILGCCLIDENVPIDVMATLNANDFYVEAHKQIFDAMMSIYSNNVAIDFYHKNKFCDVSVRKNYYPDGVDAIMMIRRF